MYSFGKEIRDFKEAEQSFVELIEGGKFDRLLEETNINKDSILDNVKAEESFVLGIDDDIDLNDMFDSTTQSDIMEEIRTRESNRENSLIIGDGEFTNGNIEGKLVYGYFVASNVYSFTHENMWLLALGLTIIDTNTQESKKLFITM